MIRCERLTPAKAEVLGVYDWDAWQCAVGETLEATSTSEEFFIDAGRLTLAAPDAAPVTLETGDWFVLEADSACHVEILEAVSGHRRVAS